METRISESQFLKRNTSNNFSKATNSTSREYVFAPVMISYHVKLPIFIFMISFGVYGMIANTLILYFKHKQHRRRRHAIRRAFRRSLSEYFINSLALSDLLCSLISFPLHSAEMFIDFVKSDSTCRFSRFLLAFFPVVTILNLLVIGIERYFCIFHPFFIISRRKAKRMVVGSWALGVLITLIPLPVFRLVYFGDIGDHSYTLVCKYDSSLPSYRALFASITFIVYIIPIFILTFINLRILKRQRNSKRVDASENIQRALSRLKVTRVFVSLIFVFIIPYLAFFVYTCFMIVSKSNVSLNNDYIVRHISVLQIYANGSISATILIYYEKLYLDFLSCFRSRPKRNIRCNKAAKRKARVNGENNRRNRSSAV